MFENFDFNVIERSWEYLFFTGMTFTLQLTLYAMVGGIIVAGGILTTVFTNWLHISEQYTLLLAGIGLIIMAIQNPKGVAGAIRDGVHMIRRRRDAKGAVSSSGADSVPVEVAV